MNGLDIKAWKPEKKRSEQDKLLLKYLERNVGPSGLTAFMEVPAGKEGSHQEVQEK